MPGSNKYNLPDIGNKISYGLTPQQKELANQLQGHFDNLRANVDTYQRIGNGQIGPEIGKLLGQYAPRGIRKAINKGALDLNVNLKNPYLGFTYRF